MKSFIKSVAVLSVIGVMVAAATYGQSTADVTATVTVQNIAVTITSDGSVAYGTLGLSDTISTLAGELNDTQTAENSGNITSKFNIRGSDSAAWTLSDSAIGANQYMHEFTTSGSFSGASGNRLHPSTYKTLTASIAPDVTQNFDLKIFTPSSSSSFAQQSVNVTVQAAMPD